MHNNLTRSELIDASCNARNFLHQARGVICAVSDTTGDNEEGWCIDALLTLVCLACQELDAAASSGMTEPAEVKGAQR
ncbi:hypothetical protein [Pantoea sp. S18]|uniref:hypothetical protein n=1 Tax=Pantoea sp. S18 TaxID=3019892 RepID=UPI002B1EF159|nr:hypothetical protein [Pantoea sp. S18]MEA5105181.1 hypothetical protein [Pantoea sp. S18]